MSLIPRELLAPFVSFIVGAFVTAFLLAIFFDIKNEDLRTALMIAGGVIAAVPDTARLFGIRVRR